MVQGKTVKRIFMISLLIIALVLITIFILPIAMPLILAFFTAAIFAPLIRLLVDRLSFKRSWAVFTVFIVYLATLGLLSYLFISKVISQVIFIAERVPSYTVTFLNQWEEWSVKILEAAEGLPTSLVYEISEQLDGFLFSMTDPLRTFDYVNFATSVVTSIPIMLVNILVYLIALFLFMLEMPNIRKEFYDHLKDETATKIQFMFKRLTDVIRGFFKAQFLVSLIILTVTLIALFIISPRIALVMSLIIWLIDFIPIIGSIVIVGPWAVIELILGNTFESISLAILAVILLTIRRTVEPKVMGQYIGLSPLATLISMFLGVKLLGMVGFIIGPLLLIAFRAAREAEIIKLDFKV